MRGLFISVSVVQYNMSGFWQQISRHPERPEKKKNTEQASEIRFRYDTDVRINRHKILKF